jgi:predicted NodU family carbamoyl transferase
MCILGISCYFHDAAAALIDDSMLVAAAEEERFSRIKHDFGFPERATRFCLESAFYCSPFDEAAILTVDGVGEWATATTGMGRGTSVSIDGEIRFPHSLGLLYSAFTAFLGFEVNEGEYKVMGLAPYGTPRYEDCAETYGIASSSTKK